MRPEEDDVRSLRSRQLEARQQQNIVNEKRRCNHLPSAAALRDPLQARPIIVAATIQIERWRKERLCSNDYICAWEALLANTERAAALLEEISPSAAQMRQNSPFVTSIRELSGFA